MTTFDEREKAEETRFVHDEEVLFKARARRNHLVGLWAAETYALVLVQLAQDQKIVDKLRDDLGPHGVSEHQIRREMDDRLPVALDHVMRA